MNRLGINADDLGLHADINRGIEACVDGGVITSVSFCPAGSAADWGLAQRIHSRGIAVGLHITLTGEPWLTDGRTIPDWRNFARLLVRGGCDIKREIRAEIAAQATAFATHGIPLSRLDSHQHVHLLPGVWPLVLDVARERSVASIRLPLAPRWRLARSTWEGQVLQALALWRRNPGARPCIGLAHSGRYSLPQVEAELRMAQGHDVELIMHPGITSDAVRSRYGSWMYDWSGEKETLLHPQFRRVVADCGYGLE